MNKTRNNEKFSNIEGLELINMPRYCTENQAEAIELICSELPNLKLGDEYIKNELIYSMQCMIHKYAKTDEDIEKLEEMIGLKQIIKNRSPVLDNMKRQGILQGREEGFKEGKEKGLEEGKKEGKKEGIEEGIIYALNELANDPDNNYNIEKLAYKFGYSVKEITNE